MGMPISARPGGVPGVVEVHQIDAPGDRAQPPHDVGKILAGGMRMAGVEAEPHPIEVGSRADRLPQPGDGVQMTGHGM